MIILHCLVVQDLHVVLHLLHLAMIGFGGGPLLKQGFKPICCYGTFLAFSTYTLPQSPATM
jgi:hypothetical protein